MIAQQAPRRLTSVALLVGSIAATAFAQVQLEAVAGGLERPVAVTHASDGSGRLFVVELPGRIRIVRDGQLLATPFLDISGDVLCCGERGLLGLAFHPDYATNGHFFVHYSRDGSGPAGEASGPGATRVVRFTVSANPDLADPASATTILALGQPAGNHNGGDLAFGPDGYLYVSLGDGGGGGDPFANGQNNTTLLGAILRLDVDGALPYEVPADNPFVGVAGADEIWVWGLRNPWRFSFDRLSGDLFIGDVGQDDWEEIDFQPWASAGGENYGWNEMEGAHCYPPSSTSCDPSSLELPIAEYAHTLGCSVTGGYRYWGHRSSTLRGGYLYGDYCSGRIWIARPVAGGSWGSSLLSDEPFQISAFGEDEDGEVYVVQWSTTNGRVHRFVEPAVILVDDLESGGFEAWSEVSQGGAP